MISSRWKLRVLKLPFVSKLIMIWSGGDLRWAYHFGLASWNSVTVRNHLLCGGHPTSRFCGLDDAIFSWDLCTLALVVVRGNHDMSEGTNGSCWACHFKIFSVDGGTASELWWNRTSMQILIVVLRADRSHSGIHQQALIGSLLTICASEGDNLIVNGAKRGGFVQLMSRYALRCGMLSLCRILIFGLIMKRHSWRRLLRNINEHCFLLLVDDIIALLGHQVIIMSGKHVVFRLPASGIRRTCHLFSN